MIRIQGFFLLLFLSLSFVGKGQDELLQQKIGVEILDLPAKEALLQIEKEMKIRFAYSSSLTKKQEGKTFQLNKNLPLEQALQSLFSNSKLSIQIIGKRVHIKEAQSQEIPTYRLHGYLKDKESGEALTGASIQVLNLENTGGVSNAYGFFSMDLPIGDYIIESAYLGYESARTSISLKGDQNLSIFLNPTSSDLQEVVAWGNKTESLSDKVQMSSHQLNISQWKKLPSSAGEPDLLKMVQLLPGVKSAGKVLLGFMLEVAIRIKTLFY